MRQLSVIWTLVCVLAGVTPASGSTVLFRPDSELIARSERVIHGRVVGQRVQRDLLQPRRIYTVTTIAVIEDFTGVAGDVVEVWELGGVIDGERLYVGGAVEYRVGQDVVVCLDRGRVGLRSVAMGLSKFDVIADAAGAPRLQRAIRNTEVIGGVVPAVDRTLDDFRALAAQTLGRVSRRSPAASQSQVSVTEPWTNIRPALPLRWRDADFGTPVRVFKNTSAPPPLVTGDAVPEFQTSLAAWTNPTNASISVQYAGTAFEPIHDGSWTTIPIHSTLVTFEDPTGDLPDAVLAIGGGFGQDTAGSGGTINGIQYDAFVNGFVVFQRASILPPEFRQPLNFMRVLTHEIGHTIGFGHTQNDGSVMNPTANIMFASCCASATPVPPALGPDDLLGLAAVYPSSPATGPSMALDTTTMRFGAVTAGGNFNWRTSAQTIRLTQTGNGTVTWTATPTRPWLQVTPTSGTGPATLSLTVVPDPNLPPNGIADAGIIFTYSGSSNAPGPVLVRLNLIPFGQSTSPIGTVDTPLENATGVTGAVPFTGWALDDIEVMRVNVCRQPVAGEVVGPTELCANAQQIFLGSAFFVEGARPDVQGSFPTYPLSGRGGWGFMVLTNMLPNQGNGSYQFAMYAQDREARITLLGTRTMTCNNAQATKPFGTIDTPEQGGLVSGTFVNFGWALTPQPKIIPLDGSTMTVMIDGVARGNVNYNHERADIENLFPNYRNTEGANGAVGFRSIDTTTLTNGLHTISWTVTDASGVTEGLGSRYFRVLNSSGPLTEAATAASTLSAPLVTVDDAALDSTPLWGRRGWDMTGEWRSYVANSSGRIVVRGEEVDRFELAFDVINGQTISGHVRSSTGLSPLPSGSQLNPSTGRFTWTPAAGFIGTYDVVFVRSVGGTAISRSEVRFVLRPKSSGFVGTQVSIDTPRSQQDVGQPFMLAGWSADLSTDEGGTGVAGLHVWAYPLAGGIPIFAGAATYGGARPDVADVHGEQFRNSGFGLTVYGLPPGNYDLAVFAWSTALGNFAPAKVVRVTVR